VSECSRAAPVAGSGAFVRGALASSTRRAM
jgi:hypothetical protein